MIFPSCYSVDGNRGQFFYVFHTFVLFPSFPFIFSSFGAQFVVVPMRSSCIVFYMYIVKFMNVVTFTLRMFHLL